MAVLVRIEEEDGPASKSKIEALVGAVYTPEILETVVWRDVVSAPAERRIIVYDDDKVVSSAGVIFRDGLLDDISVRICGIGGVLTLPTARKQGFGRATMLAAHKLLERPPACDIGLLFCERQNFDFYSNLGWSFFEGTVMAKQPNSDGKYHLMQAMVKATSCPAPFKGVIDLKGLPW